LHFKIGDIRITRTTS